MPGWLEDRLETVYKAHPGYSEKASTLFTVDLGAPEDLPDALRGEKWSFVQLPLATLQQASGRAEGGQREGACRVPVRVGEAFGASLGLPLNLSLTLCCP